MIAFCPSFSRWFPGDPLLMPLESCQSCRALTDWRSHFSQGQKNRNCPGKPCLDIGNMPPVAPSLPYHYTCPLHPIPLVYLPLLDHFALLGGEDLINQLFRITVVCHFSQRYLHLNQKVLQSKKNEYLTVGFFSQGRITINFTKRIFKIF